MIGFDLKWDQSKELHHKTRVDMEKFIKDLDENVKLPELPTLPELPELPELSMPSMPSMPTFHDE